MELPIEELQDELKRTTEAEQAIYKASNQADDKYPKLKEAWHSLYQRKQKLEALMEVVAPYLPKTKTESEAPVETHS